MPYGWMWGTRTIGLLVTCFWMVSTREHIFIECTRDAENLIDNNIIWNVEGRYNRDALPEEPGSSGWYKTKELDIKNGYGIYLEGTDRLRIVNNLIGKCHKAGFFAKVVAFRITRTRGGTSRKIRFLTIYSTTVEKQRLSFPMSTTTSMVMSTPRCLVDICV